MQPMKWDYYTVEGSCHNCYWHGRVDIIRGNPVSSQACPNCGMKRLRVAIRPTLQKVLWPWGHRA